MYCFTVFLCADVVKLLTKWVSKYVKKFGEVQKFNQIVTMHHTLSSQTNMTLTTA